MIPKENIDEDNEDSHQATSIWRFIDGDLRFHQAELIMMVWDGRQG